MNLLFTLLATFVVQCPDGPCEWRLVPGTEGRPALLSEDGILVGYPPEEPPSDPNPTDPDAEFAALCSGPGVVFCDPLDDEGPWGRNAAGDWVRMANPDGTSGIPTTTWWRNWRGVGQREEERSRPAIDHDVKASGSGSLHFVYESQSGPSGAGEFATNFSDDLSQQFGEGESFFLRYRIRFNCEWLWKDCDPSSPTYKMDRRVLIGTDGRPMHFKQAIISGGDQVLGAKSSSACDALQIVITHGMDHMLSAYHACGWYKGMGETVGRVSGIEQVYYQLGGDYDCWRVPDPDNPRKAAWGYTGPNCFRLDSDEWMTIQVGVEVGPRQPDREGERLSRFTLWAAHEGEPLRVVIKNDFYLRGTEDPLYRFGKVWLLPFSTRKDPELEHPTGHIYYDELVMGRKFIGGSS